MKRARERERGRLHKTDSGNADRQRQVKSVFKAVWTHLFVCFSCLMTCRLTAQVPEGTIEWFSADNEDWMESRWEIQPVPDWRWRMYWEMKGGIDIELEDYGWWKEDEEIERREEMKRNDDKKKRGRGGQSETKPGMIFWTRVEESVGIWEAYTAGISTCAIQVLCILIAFDPISLRSFLNYISTHCFFEYFYSLPYCILLDLMRIGNTVILTRSAGEPFYYRIYLTAHIIPERIG